MVPDGWMCTWNQISCDMPHDKLHIDPGDTLHTNPGDTLHTDPGDTLHIDPGDTLHIDPGDTLHTDPGDTLHIDPGDTLHIDPGDTCGLICTQDTVDIVTFMMSITNSHLPPIPIKTNEVIITPTSQ